MQDFKRHVWHYRDESGQTALCAPPDVFAVVLDDADEADITITAAKLLSGPLGFGDRVRTEFRGPNAVVSFRDLQTLHAFLQVMCNYSDREPAREVAEFCLAQLGIAWKTA